MGKTYQPWNPNQQYLLPPSVQDWLPENDLVYFLLDTVSELDISAITEKYEQEKRGFPPFHPRMMVALLLYSYCRGIYSSRKIMQACQERKKAKEQWGNFWKNNQDSIFTKLNWSKKRIIKLLDKYIQKNRENVLDAGCGNGFFSKYFLGNGCKVWSCDYSEYAITLTKQNTDNRCESYLKKDLLDKGSWREYANFFDVIFTDGLFEHFNYEQQKQLIENFISIKKEKGLIITFVPNKLSWWTIIRPIFMPGIYEKPFTMSRLRELHSPLEILDYGGINTFPVKYSPDKLLGSRFGMLLYMVAK